MLIKMVAQSQEQESESGPSFEEFVEAMESKANRQDLFSSGILVPDESTNTKDEQYPHERGFVKEYDKGSFLGNDCSHIFISSSMMSFELPGIGRMNMGKGIYEDAMEVSFDAEKAFSEESERLCDKVISFLDENQFGHRADFGTSASVDYFVMKSRRGMSKVEAGNMIQENIAKMLEKEYEITEIQREPEYILLKKEGIEIQLCYTNEHGLFNSAFIIGGKGSDSKMLKDMQKSVTELLNRDYKDVIREPHTREPRTSFKINVFYKMEEIIKLDEVESEVFMQIAQNISKFRGLGIKNYDDLIQKIFIEGIEQMKYISLNPGIRNIMADRLIGTPIDILSREIRESGPDRGTPFGRCYNQIIFSKLMKHVKAVSEDDKEEMEENHDVQPSFSEITVTIHGRDICDYENLLKNPYIRNRFGSDERIRGTIVNIGILSLYSILCQYENLPPQDKFN